MILTNFHSLQTNLESELKKQYVKISKQTAKESPHYEHWFPTLDSGFQLLLTNPGPCIIHARKW